MACETNKLEPVDGDVWVIAQKIVSKAEGRPVDLVNVRPSPRAREIAAEVEKGPSLGRSHPRRVESAWYDNGDGC